MPRATHEPSTPELRATRYIRATPPVAVELRQPVAPGEVRSITGRVLGEMYVDGRLHHLRVVDGDGVLFLVPPEWIKPLILRPRENPKTSHLRNAPNTTSDSPADFRVLKWTEYIYDEKRSEPVRTLEPAA